MTQKHRQVWTKINIQVDVQIKDLIDALSLFPKLHTISSCQQTSNKNAWVNFIYGEHEWKDLADFVFNHLGQALVSKLGDLVNISISITENGFYECDLVVRPGAMKSVISIIRRLHKEMNARHALPLP